MDADDSIDIIEGFLAINSALTVIGANLPAEASAEVQRQTNLLLDVCRTMLDRRKARRAQPLIGLLDGKS